MDNAKKNKWFIAIKEREPHFLKDGYVGPDGVKIIEPAEGTYHADPFLFRNLIFFELYDYKKGVIACMEKDGSNIRVILDEPNHLSFPFLIEDEGEVYMVPETGAGEIEIYRCLEFPDKWDFAATLARGSFGDTTIKKIGDKYLMFSTEGDNNLVIFEARDILGPWDKIYSEAHMHSRSAGNIFEMDGKLIRPTQDGNVYGERIYFKENYAGCV